MEIKFKSGYVMRVPQKIAEEIMNVLLQTKDGWSAHHDEDGKLLLMVHIDEVECIMDRERLKMPVEKTK